MNFIAVFSNRSTFTKIFCTNKYLFMKIGLTMMIFVGQVMKTPHSTRANPGRVASTLKYV